jgi:ribosomal protein S17E
MKCADKLVKNEQHSHSFNSQGAKEVAPTNDSLSSLNIEKHFETLTQALTVNQEMIIKAISDQSKAIPASFHELFKGLESKLEQYFNHNQAVNRLRGAAMASPFIKQVLLEQ